MEELAAEFMSVFAGLPRAYGTYAITTARSGDGKQLGQAQTIKAKVTLELWNDHLSGKQGLGIVPIRDDNTVVFGAIDVDVYDNFDIGAVVKQTRSLDIPVVPCRSKSGGCHLYLFTNVPIPAKVMRKRLSEIAALLGFGQCEIFPKQSTILAERGDVGGWINMPYFSGVRGLRYAVEPNGDALDPAKFLQHAKALQQDATFFETPLKRGSCEDALPEAPPCLQIMASHGIPEGQRNEAMFAFGVYAKKAWPDNWQAQLSTLNQMFFFPPLSGDEITGAIRSLGRKDYQYTCSKDPLLRHCNSAVCRTRKHGVGDGTAGHFPVLGQLRKLTTDPPLWFWDIDGNSLELTTAELQTPRLFQGRCMEVLEVMPMLPSAGAWQNIVNTALTNVVRLDAPADSSAEGLLWNLLEDFCTGRMQGQSRDEVLNGKPWTDTDTSITWFRMTDFMTFLERRHFRTFQPHKITAIMKLKGAKHKFVKLRGKGVNIWGVKAFDMPDEELPVSDEIEKDSVF